MIRSECIDLSYGGENIRLSAKVRRTGDHLVVFMHGFGCAKECFDGAFDAECLSSFSLCSFDFPGHGHSSKPGTAIYSLQAYADISNSLIDALIDLISPARVSMVCHSMGGAVGLIASQGRSDLAWFVNIDGNLVHQDCGIVSRRTASQSLQQFTGLGFSNFLHALKASDRPDQRAWAPWYGRADPAALHETARSLVEWSDSGKLLDLFSSLRYKAYIYGEREPKDYLLPQLAGISTYPIADSGHFVMLDSPEEFYRLLATVLRQPTARLPVGKRSHFRPPVQARTRSLSVAAALSKITKHLQAALSRSVGLSLIHI